MLSLLNLLLERMNLRAQLGDLLVFCFNLDLESRVDLGEFLGEGRVVLRTGVGCIGMSAGNSGNRHLQLEPLLGKRMEHHEA